MMKIFLYISVLMILLGGCSSKKHVTKIDRVITREINTLVTVPAKTATFIPIAKDSVEILVDRETGIELTFFYEDVMIPPNKDTVVVKMPVKAVVETPEEVIPIKAKETTEESVKDKEVIGIPWFYKASLWVVIVLIALTIIKYFIKNFPL